MSKIILKNFTTLSLEEQKMVLTWRNNIEIRQWMYSQDIISLEDHLSYVSSLESKKDRYYFLVKKDDENIGVIDFTSIDRTNGTAEIGLYAKPQSKGNGKHLMQEIIKYGFNDIKISKLLANVFITNQKAIALYKRFGFKEYKTDDNLVYMELNNENR